MLGDAVIAHAVVGGADGGDGGQEVLSEVVPAVRQHPQIYSVYLRTHEPFVMLCKSQIDIETYIRTDRGKCINEASDNILASIFL